MEKMTIKIERVFSVKFRASPAIRRSFQPSPQPPTVLQQTSDLIHNWLLQMQDGIFQATPLLTLLVTCRLHVDINVYCRGRDVYCNRCCNYRVGESTWSQLLLTEVVTIASTWHQH